MIRVYKVSEWNAAWTFSNANSGFVWVDTPNDRITVYTGKDIPDGARGEQ